MIQVRRLQQLLATVPGDAKVWAYEGEDVGIGIRHGEATWWIRAEYDDKEDSYTSGFESTSDVDARAALERAVAGALRSAINDHGPITPDKIGSAVKRVLGNLANIGPAVPDGPPNDLVVGDHLEPKPASEVQPTKPWPRR